MIARTAAHLLPAPAAAAPELLDADARERFQRQGYLRLASFFSADESESMSRPVERAHTAPGSPVADVAGTNLRPSGSATRFNFPDLHSGCQTDETVATSLAEATLGNGRLVAAVESMLGEPAEVAQFGALLTKPGDNGAMVHFDYKPYRTLGSSLHWLVVVIPLTDYTPAHGPLMVSPGKHKATRVLPTTNGRTHPISVAAIPAQSDTPGTRPPMVGGVVGVDLLDPELRRGDMFLFNGFTWHFAAPNQGPATRLGLYMKFRARDGTQTIDRAVWILEDGVSHEICMLANGELPGVDLPSTGVMRQNDTGAWDLANVIGACLDHAGLLAGCDLGWLSWVTDHKFNAGEENEQVVRVYGHISEGSLAGQAAQLARSGVRFAPASASATGGAEREWIRCWQESRDVASGVVVRRGFGFPLDRGHEMEGWQSDDGTGPADEAASFLVNADVLKLKGE